MTTRRFDERTGRARSTFAKNEWSSWGSLTAGDTTVKVFPGLAGYLRRIKHVRGELTLWSKASSSTISHAEGWFGFSRISRGEDPVDDIDNPRVWTPRTYAYAGSFGLSRTWPVDLMACNVTPDDDIYFMIEGKETGDIGFGLSLIWNEERQSRIG